MQFKNVLKVGLNFAELSTCGMGSFLNQGHLTWIPNSRIPHTIQGPQNYRIVSRTPNIKTQDSLETFTLLVFDPSEVSRTKPMAFVPQQPWVFNATSPGRRVVTDQDGGSNPKLKDSLLWVPFQEACISTSCGLIYLVGAVYEAYMGLLPETVLEKLQSRNSRIMGSPTARLYTTPPLPKVLNFAYLGLTRANKG